MTDIAILRTIAREAGRYISGKDASNASRQKLNAKDLVTVADIKSQDMIRKSLLEHFPGAIVLSEEDDESVRQPMYAPDFTGYVLDPIDGTYNFKRNMQESAISIGYIENGRSVAGVVYDPFKDEMYEAEIGKGARRNGELIHVSNQADLTGASIATSNSYDDAAMARNVRRHLAIYEQTGDMPWTMCPGSGVLIMTNIACGRFDAYHHNGLKPWDNAAAFLIVCEAGGVVQPLALADVDDVHTNDTSFTASAVLIGTPNVVARLREVFGAIDPALLK